LSRFSATVADGGRLEYLPEPVVVTAGARHATLVSVTLSAGASLVLRDEVLLGRHGEPGGTVRSVSRVSHAGRPLLRHSLELSGSDPASLGPAVLAGHRAVGTLLRVNGPEMAEIPVSATPEVAVMPLAGPGFLVTALAHDAVNLRRRLTVPD
jgi:urease accessory protein